MSKMMTSRRCLVVLMAAALSLSFSRWAEEEPQYGGTLTVLYAHAVRSLDPYRDTGTGGIPILNHILESLVGYDDQGKIVPVLAESMPTISADGLEYVFHLRKGIRFHDGTDFTAEDVKFSFDRVMNPDVSTQRSKLSPFIDGADVLDDHTVRIRLKKRWVDFLSLMASDKCLDILSPENVQQLGKDFGVKGIAGTGPFKLEEWKKGASAVLVKNEDYWQQGKPYLDKMVWKEIPEHATRELAFLSGEGDVLYQVPLMDVEDFKKRKNVRVFEMPSGLTAGIWFNTRKAAINDKRVRQALSMALDREGIVDAVYFGHGSPSGGILPDFFKGYYVPRELYDVEKAKRIMEELGYRQSNPLKFELMYRAEPDYAEIATIVQAIWYQIHVAVTLRPIKASGLLPVILGDDPPYTAMCMRITGGPFPYDHVFRMYSRDSYLNTVGYNKKGGVQNPRLEELLNQSVGEVDEEKAKAIYREISDIIFLEDVPVAPIAIPSNIDITYDYVRGWVPDMADYVAKTNVWISKK